MICVECGNKNMRQTTDKLRERYKSHKYCIEGVPHYVCDKCGEIVYPAASLKMLDEADKFVDRLTESKSDLELQRLDKYLQEDLQKTKEGSGGKIPILRITKLESTDTDFSYYDYNLLAKIICG